MTILNTEDLAQCIDFVYRHEVYGELDVWCLYGIRPVGGLTEQLASFSSEQELIMTCAVYGLSHSSIDQLPDRHWPANF